MRKLDPRLRYLLSKTTGLAPESNVTIESTAEKSSFLEFVEPIKSPREIPKVSAKKQPPYKVAILVSCNRNFELESLRKAGMNVYSIIKGFYTVVSGEVLTSDLHKLDELEFVMQVEAPRPMMLEELDISLVETGANAVHDFDLPVKGKGVIVAIIDSGIDYTHPSFRDQDGTSRILYLWDQDAPSEHQQDPTEEMEEGLFTHDGKVKYGREYTREQIDQVLRNGQNSSAVVPHIHKDTNGHGTHVAGIAAGNGFVADINDVFSQDNYAGIAPEADLIVVALKRPNNQPDRRITLGNSANALQALDYIVQRANGRPIAINISLGTNAGGHSGETLLETAIDNLARQCNVVIVKSAGNEQTKCIHAGGTINQAEEVILELDMPSYTTITYLELWYENSTDQNISIALRSPSGETINFVNSENSDGWIERTLAGRNIRIDSDQNTGDTVITIRIDTYIAGGNIQPENWQLLLRGNQITEGRYDIWIDNSDNAIKFTESCADASRTITIPGTAKQIITVGSYVIRHRDNDLSQPTIGSISSFSCSGTTRYGLQKPEIAAPGEWIISARSTQCNELPYFDKWHTTLRGTSMAAPHVTGASALILSVCPGLTCEQVKQILMKTALSDNFTSEVPNHSWGSGKLNVQAAVKFAYQCAENFLFPRISNVQINRATLSWETDMLTKAIVRFHTQQDKLRLGKFLGQQEDNILTNNHTLTLSTLSQGKTYYYEIVAISKDGWWTVDDNPQQVNFQEFYAEFYEITIPGNVN